MIIDVKSIVESKKIDLVKRVNDLKKKGSKPKLAVLLASDDKASRIYVSKKKTLCAQLGIEEVEYIFNDDVKEKEILETIEKLNQDSSIHGILVQLPLFDHLNEKKILEHLDYHKDVDGLHPMNLGNLLSGKSCMKSCTPKGIMTILNQMEIPIEGKHAVIIGRSILVGKPIAHLLLDSGATVTICHSKTIDLSQYTKEADILVVAVGRPLLITKDMVKKGCVVVDVGINRLESKIVGDCDTDAISEIAEITPVPGGVGLTTVLSLMENVIEVCENNH